MSKKYRSKEDVLSNLYGMANKKGVNIIASPYDRDIMIFMVASKNDGGKVMGLDVAIPMAMRVPPKHYNAYLSGLAGTITGMALALNFVRDHGMPDVWMEIDSGEEELVIREESEH